MRLGYRSNTGFTLVELLLALAIFAYSASSILKLVSQSASNLVLLEEMTIASYVASNRLAELQVETTWPPKHNHKGEVNMANKDWFWRQEVKETEDQRLRHVTVFVMLDEQGSDSVYQLATYVSQPPRPKL